MIILVLISFVLYACVMDRVDSRLNIVNESPYSVKVVFECKNIDCLFATAIKSI